MKRAFTLVVGLILSLSLFSGQAFAASNGLADSQIESFKNDTLQSLKSQYPNAQFIEIDEQKEKSIKEFTPFAAAPPLTYLQVYAAISTTYPEYEYFSENQLTSIEDHGGNELYIVTVELGYGSTRFARMNGERLSLYDRQDIDLDGDNIVDGSYLWWDASGHEAGEFTYQNTSSNSPWNTMSDKINIR